MRKKIYDKNNDNKAKSNKINKAVVPCLIGGLMVAGTSAPILADSLPTEQVAPGASEETKPNSGTTTDSGTASPTEEKQKELETKQQELKAKEQELQQLESDITNIQANIDQKKEELEKVKELEKTSAGLGKKINKVLQLDEEMKKLENDDSEEARKQREQIIKQKVELGGSFEYFKEQDEQLQKERAKHKPALTIQEEIQKEETQLQDSKDAKTRVEEEIKQLKQALGMVDNQSEQADPQTPPSGSEEATAPSAGQDAPPKAGTPSTTETTAPAPAPPATEEDKKNDGDQAKPTEEDKKHEEAEALKEHLVEEAIKEKVLEKTLTKAMVKASRMTNEYQEKIDKLDLPQKETKEFKDMVKLHDQLEILRVNKGKDLEKVNDLYKAGIDKNYEKAQVLKKHITDTLVEATEMSNEYLKNIDKLGLPKKETKEFKDLAKLGEQIAILKASPLSSWEALNDKYFDALNSNYLKAEICKNTTENLKTQKGEALTEPEKAPYKSAFAKLKESGKLEQVQKDLEGLVLGLKDLTKPAEDLKTQKGEPLTEEPKPEYDINDEDTLKKGLPTQKGEALTEEAKPEYNIKGRKILKDKLPQTGERSNALQYTFAMILSAMAFGVTLFRRKKEK